MQKQLQLITGRSLQLEYRKGFGWFIVEGKNTLMGFNSKKLLRAYVANVAKRGYLYPPTKRETYGK